MTNLADDLSLQIQTFCMAMVISRYTLRAQTIATMHAENFHNANYLVYVHYIAVHSLLKGL